VRCEWRPSVLRPRSQARGVGSTVSQDRDDEQQDPAREEVGTTTLVRLHAVPRSDADDLDPDVLARVEELSRACRHWFHQVAMMLADMAGWILALVIAVVVRKVAGGEYPYSLYLAAWPALLVPLPIFVFQGLYAPVPPSAPDELGRLVRANTIAFAGLAIVVFLFQSGEAYSRLVFILGYLFSLVLTPLSRWSIRAVCSRSGAERRARPGARGRV